MAGHGFKALQTFRGWSEEYNRWRFGYLLPSLSNDMYIFPHIDGMRLSKTKVVPESIGIYIGKDDNTKWEDRPDWLKHIPKEDWTGVPIFAWLPEDGNIGGDIVKCEYYYIGILRYGEYPHDGHAYEENDSSGFFVDFAFDIKRHGAFEIIGTQYEQYLKEKKNV